MNISPLLTFWVYFSKFFTSMLRTWCSAAALIPQTLVYLQHVTISLCGTSKLERRAVYTESSLEHIAKWQRDCIIGWKSNSKQDAPNIDLGCFGNITFNLLAHKICYFDIILICRDVFELKNELTSNCTGSKGRRFQIKSIFTRTLFETDVTKCTKSFTLSKSSRMRLH